MLCCCIYFQKKSGLDCEDGSNNRVKLWSLRRKLFPRSRDPPTAMLDSFGNLITSQEGVEDEAIKTYKKRLENRLIKDDLEQLKKAKDELCAHRLQLVRSKQTPDWTMAQLETVLKSLKLNKSKDPHGYAHELFKDAAGDDLKKAILLLMNRIKREQRFPKALEICNITSIWKKKKSRNNFDNYRGIFRVSVFRSILEKLIYNDEYFNIDKNLSDSNVGARKGRNIRDNLFVVNAVVNSVIKGKEDAVDLQLYDVEKCFDSLWVEECINDIYEAGLDNDKLAILYKENQNAACAVKVNDVLSNRFNMKNIVIQGTVFNYN